MTHVDEGSNVILVTSPSLLHNVIKTTNEVGNTGGGAASTTHTGELHMLLDTPTKTILLIIKQAYVIPSNDHIKFYLSPFLMHSCHRVPHAMNEHVTIELEDADQVIIHVSLIKNTLYYVRVTIIQPSSDDDLPNINIDPIPVCLRATMKASSLNQALTIHEEGLHSSFYLD